MVIKPQLKKNYGVKTLTLFGSYSSNEVLPESDIDVMIEFDKSPGIRFIYLADELEQLLHHKVDLVSGKAVKPNNTCLLTAAHLCLTGIRTQIIISIAEKRFISSKAAG